VTYKEVTANPTIAADAFAMPDAVKAAAKPPATGNVPYQWVIRRIFLGRFLDSDGIIAPLGTGLKLVELAPNVQHVQGGTANNLIVAMKDHLVVFDAPYGELQSRWVIDEAKKKYPGKPIKYLVLTHHHMDHTGGTRTFMAEGATVIVPAPDKAYFEKVARMPHTIVPDELAKKKRAVKVQEVKDQMSFKDDSDEIRLYNITNPHADGMILGHIVKENVVWVTDILSPRGPIERNAGTLAVGEAFKKYGITGSTIAGGHGATAKQADIGPALGMEVTSR
jgi:glyoxylase-like metal-dependent hydrolase (beta-lactamase superfamily II)